MEIVCCNMCFSFEYSISICLLIEINVNKSRCNWWPLFTYANHLLLHVLSFWIFNIYLFTYSDWCQQNHKLTTCFYLLMQITYCDIWFLFEYWISIYLFIMFYLLMQNVCCLHMFFKYLFVYSFKFINVKQFYDKNAYRITSIHLILVIFISQYMFLRVPKPMKLLLTA